MTLLACRERASARGRGAAVGGRARRLARRHRVGRLDGHARGPGPRWAGLRPSYAIDTLLSFVGLLDPASLRSRCAPPPGEAQRFRSPSRPRPGYSAFDVGFGAFPLHAYCAWSDEPA